MAHMDDMPAPIDRTPFGNPLGQGLGPTERKTDPRARLLRVLVPYEVTGKETSPQPVSDRWLFTMIQEQSDFFWYFLRTILGDAKMHNGKENYLGLVACLQLATADEQDEDLRKEMAEEFYRRYVFEGDSMYGAGSVFPVNLPMKVLDPLKKWWADEERFKEGWWNTVQRAAVLIMAELGNFLIDNSKREGGMWEYIRTWTLNMPHRPTIAVPLAWEVYNTTVLQPAVQAKLANPVPEAEFSATKYASHPVAIAGEGSIWHSELVPTMRARNEVRALLLLEQAVPADRSTCRFPIIKRIREKDKKIEICSERIIGPSLKDVMDHKEWDAVDQGAKDRFIKFVAKDIIQTLHVVHARGIGHHRLSARSLRFVHAEYDAIINNDARLVLTDFTAARFYPQQRRGDDSKREMDKNPLVPCEAVLNSSITCRSFPDTKRAAEEALGWPAPPELSLDVGHPTTTPQWDTQLAPFLIAEMGKQTDLWDAGILIAQLFKFSRPTTQLRNEAELTDWLDKANKGKPADVRVGLKLLLHADPKSRKTAAHMSDVVGGWSAKGYVRGGGRVGGGAYEEAGAGQQSWLDEDLLLPCPEVLCHRVYADHQRLVADNRKLKAQLRDMAALVRQAAAALPR